MKKRDPQHIKNKFYQNLNLLRSKVIFNIYPKATILLMISAICHFIYFIITENEYQLKLLITRMMIAACGFTFMCILKKQSKNPKHYVYIDMTILVFMVIVILGLLFRDKDFLKGNGLREDGLSPFLLGILWALFVQSLVVFIISSKIKSLLIGIVQTLIIVIVGDFSTLRLYTYILFVGVL